MERSGAHGADEDRSVLRQLRRHAQPTHSCVPHCSIRRMKIHAGQQRRPPFNTRLRRVRLSAHPHLRGSATAMPVMISAASWGLPPSGDAAAMGREQIVHRPHQAPLAPACGQPGCVATDHYGTPEPMDLAGSPRPPRAMPPFSGFDRHQQRLSPRSAGRRSPTTLPAAAPACNQARTRCMAFLPERASGPKAGQASARPLPAGHRPDRVPGDGWRHSSSRDLPGRPKGLYERVYCVRGRIQNMFHLHKLYTQIRSAPRVTDGKLSSSGCSCTRIAYWLLLELRRTVDPADRFGSPPLLEPLRRAFL